MKKLRSLGTVLLALGIVEATWAVFCVFSGLLLGAVGFADDQLGLPMWALGGAYWVLALANLPLAAVHGFAGLRLRGGKAGIVLTMIALAACLISFVLALYCFPVSLGALVYGIVVLLDPDAREALDPDPT